MPYVLLFLVVFQSVAINSYFFARPFFAGDGELLLGGDFRTLADEGEERGERGSKAITTFFHTAAELRKKKKRSCYGSNFATFYCPYTTADRSSRWRRRRRRRPWAITAQEKRKKKQKEKEAQTVNVPLTGLLTGLGEEEEGGKKGVRQK